MSEHATASFDIKSWNEEPYNEAEELPRLTRSTLISAYQGDIEGEGTAEILTVYRDDDTATYLGLERVIGRLRGRSGSFVLQHTGTFEEGTAKTTWLVVPGSGTGELRGLRGEGGFAASEGRHVSSATLDYDFE